MPTPANLCGELRRRLESNDLDGGLRMLSEFDVFAAIRRAGPCAGRIANMSADLYDYGGQYANARKALATVGEQARERIARFIGERSTAHPPPKDEAWTVIHLGMSFYRSGEKGYQEALQCFEAARRALLIIESQGHRCNGSIARVWYCIGLVHRQCGLGPQAREAFSNCIAYGWKGVERRARDGQPAGTFDYHIGKCFGLGRAWLSYNEASLSTAHDYVVAARRLLHEVDPQKNKFRFIHAYIEIVHAGIIMSRYSEPERLDDAIRILTKSYEDLGGDAALAQPSAGHRPYALRALVELARAHLQRAVSSPHGRPEQRKQHLETALELTAKATSSEGAKEDARTFCNAFIVESRIHRAAEQDAGALRSALKAMEIGRRGEFSRIDCWITLGEAKYWGGDYQGAVDAFLRALTFGHSNRKIFAVCHLHLANTYLRLDRSKAREHYGAWEATRRGQENAFIRGLAERVRLSLGEFVIAADTIRDQIASRKPGIVGEHVKSLQKWIAEVARANAEGDVNEAARVLERDPKTLLGYLRHEDPPDDDDAE